MGIRNIHIILISASIILSVIYGAWCLNHDYIVFAWSSFIMAAGLVIYGIKFIRKTKIYNLKNN